ncbi:MAG TPA: redoxin domain-containing protein [Candidatus Aminicenantes bacterium]|nr:redoxin domain-containing protein [Candidatus Aminicenantes bacterium]
MKARTICALAMLLIVAAAALSPAQAAPIKPVKLGDRFPDITLPAAQGGEVALSSLRGKNVLIVFPRGRVDDHWCQLCHYQYAELADLEKTLQFRKKYGLEVLFVLPYDMATVKHWVEIFPEQMAVIDKWKNPGAEELKNPRAKAWAEQARQLLPKNLAMTKESMFLPFPILADGNRALSEGLQLFTLFWDYSYVEQNMAAVFILDKEGVVRFKYFSQGTTDRPGAEYLLKFIERML